MVEMIQANIRAPKYVNIKLNNDAYILSISLHISEDVYTVLSREDNIFPMKYNNKYYIHWDSIFSYFMSFDEAFDIAYKRLKSMKIMIRNAKIQLLTEEIEEIATE